MPLYKYKAVDRSGRSQSGETDLPSVDKVADWLIREGLAPVDIQPVVNRGAGKVSSAGRQWFKRRPSASQRVLSFTRDLSVMLGSGLPLDKSLQLLEKMSDADSRSMIADLRNDVRRGIGLAQAFEARGLFSPFYVSMVRAGELSGNLEASLSRMAEYLEQAKATRKMIVAALTYPAILFAVAVLSLVFLLAWVVPGFAELFDDMGGELPAPTRIVMAASDFVAEWWWLILLLCFGGVWLCRRLWQTPAARAWFDRRVLAWPLFGELVANIETSRFTRTLGVLLQGGVTMVSALLIARETVGNLTLRDELVQAETALREGRSLSATLLENQRFPLMALHMVQVGEETGRLEEMLLKVAVIYEEEVKTVIQRLLALLEPLLILTLGALIAGIIVSILLGILGVNELIG